MVNEIIYAKTQKGFEEMTRRTYRLPARTRALLIMVDGKETAGELISRAQNREESEQVIERLLAEGFIEPIDQPSPHAGEPQPASTAGSPAAFRPPADSIALAAAKRYMVQALVDALGVEADRFTMKIEQAPGIDSLRVIGLEYLEVIRRTSDRRRADAFRDGLVQLRLIAPTEAAPASPGAVQPAVLAAAQRLMTQLLLEALGPDADSFTIAVERASSGDELRALLPKYHDAVRAHSGRRKADEFVQRVGALLDQPHSL